VKNPVLAGLACNEGAHDKIIGMKKSVLFMLFVTSLAACVPAPAAATPAPPSGTVLFQDEFEQNTTGWDRLANDIGIMDYDSGGYRMLIRQPSFNFWSTPEVNFGDVRVEVDATRLNGPDENRLGLMCRYQNGNYYFFVISNDGYYAIGKFINGQSVLLGQSAMQASPAIQPGTMHHLRADCIGDSLTFYINFNLIAGAQDAELANGDVGLIAGSFSEPGVDVMFDHFVVMQP
jgi:hypothetical protein